MSTAGEGKVTHVLVPRGRPLCGFTNDVYAYWPKNQDALPLPSWEDVTCLNCKKLAEALMEEERKNSANKASVPASTPVPPPAPAPEVPV